jgi:hypothetical protein
MTIEKKETLQKQAAAAMLANADRVAQTLPVCVLRRIVIRNEWHKNNGFLDTSIWVARAVERHGVTKQWVYKVIGKTRKSKQSE